MTLSLALSRLLPRRVAPAAAARPVLVCAACEARSGAPPLAAALRTVLRTTGLAHHAVVEVDCLGLCPEGRVCVVAGERCLLVDPWCGRDTLRAAMVDALAPR